MENRITEQASAYDNLQRMSVHDILTGINREDACVHEAVAKTIPVMERLVERVVERMERGGRMFYIGAGTSGTPRSFPRPMACPSTGSSA